MDFSVSSTPVNSALSTPFMGHTKVMVGFSGGTNVGDLAPFDAQYQYINSSAFSSYDHAGCIAGSVPLASCGGWTAWQEDVPTRGLFARRFVDAAKGRIWNGVARPQIPFFTYYMVLPASGRAEGADPTGETAALNDATFLTTYFNDWRFLLQKIGTDQAILHIEPDLFGFLKARAATTTGLPSAIPAKVASSNPTDCGAGYTEDAAGYVKCMIHMVRVYASNAKVGVHASPWVISDPEATAWSNFLIALGAGDGDFLVWQLPLGNSYQNNTYQHYKDQRVELLFSHMADVRDAHVLGLFFGSGEGAQTHVESDGGLLIGKAKQHYISRGSVN